MAGAGDGHEVEGLAHLLQRGDDLHRAGGIDVRVEFADGEVLAGAAGDEPHVTFEGVLLALQARPDAAVALVLALLIDPVKLHVLTELVDELQARGLDGASGCAQLDFHRGGLHSLFLRQTECLERRCCFSASTSGVDQNELMRARPCLHSIPERFAIRQPVRLHSVAEDFIFGALRQRECGIEVCSGSDATAEEKGEEFHESGQGQCCQQANPAAE